MNKQKTVYYYPGDGYNSYIDNNINILELNYSVIPISKRNFRKHILNLLFSNRKNNILLLNWIEHAFFNKKITKFTFLKVFLFFLLAKTKFKIIAYTRHNHYPHKTDQIVEGKLLLDYISNKSDVLFTHSKFEEGIYIPHPLYIDNSDIFEDLHDITNITDSYIIFGVIHEYKKIDEFLKLSGADTKIIIVGEIPDEEYKKKIYRYRSKNIQFLSKRVNDHVAQSILKRSKGLIVIHSDSLLISGSMMYAASINVDIHIKKNNYLKYLLESKIINTLHIYDHISYIFENVESKSNLRNNLDYFSESKISEIFKNSFDKYL